MAAADICLSLRAICSGDSLGSLRIIMCIWSLSVYPADEQRVLFAETFGCCRFVYNWALNLKITAYKERKETLGNVYLTNLMKSEPKAEHEWLSEISSQSLQSALRNPDTAYTDFFRNTHALASPVSSHVRTGRASSVRSIGVWISPKAQLRFPKPKIFQPCPGSNPI